MHVCVRACVHACVRVCMYVVAQRPFDDVERERKRHFLRLGHAHTLGRREGQRDAGPLLRRPVGLGQLLPQLLHLLGELALHLVRLRRAEGDNQGGDGCLARRVETTVERQTWQGENWGSHLVVEQVLDDAYHFTRNRGSKKPPTTYAEFRHCNAWHLKDVLKFAAPVLLQPFLFSNDEVAQSQAFGHACVETVCLIAAFYEQQSALISTERHRIQLKMLAREWIGSMSCHTDFGVGFKPHQAAAHAHESIKDLGTAHTEQHAEHAHKWCRLMYELKTSLGKGYQAQLATVRNRHLAAWHLRLQAPEPRAAAPKEKEPFTEFSYTTHVIRLTLTVDERFKVVDLVCATLPFSVPLSL